jgi:hypothetical protein
LATIRDFLTASQSVKLLPSTWWPAWSSLRTPCRAGAAEVSVCNVAGQTVLGRALSVGREASSVVLDLPYLSAGVYLVKLSSDSFAATQKLVVQR